MDGGRDDAAAMTGSQGKVVTPPLTGRVSYVFGGTMPPRYRAWVLRDLTAPGWRWRQALRPLLMMLPVAIIFALLPGPVGTRGTLVGFLLVAPFALGLALSASFRNRRLTAHGLPVVPAAKPRPASARPANARPAGAKPAGAEVDATPANAPASATAVAPAHAAPATATEDLDDPDGINA